MPLNLAEYKASSENALDRQVIDQFRRSSWLLDNIQFDDGAHPNAGGAAWVYAYDRLTTEPTATSRAVNTEFTAQEAKTTKVSVELKIFGGSAQVDRTQVRTARYGERIAFQLAQKIKATRALFADYFINGDAGTTATEFDGLSQLLSGQDGEVAAVAGDLSTSANIDTNYKAFLDEIFAWLAVLDGTPSALLMNRTMKSKMRSVAHRAGFFTDSEDAFGRMVSRFDGIPMIDLGDKPGTANPIIATAAGTPDTTSIYAVRLGMDGVHAISPETTSAFLNTYLPDMDEDGAVKTAEVEMVSAVALKHLRSAGVFTGVGVAP